MLLMTVKSHARNFEGLQIGLEAIKLSLKDLDELKRTVNEKLLT